MLEEEDVVLDLPRYWEKINMDMPVASDNKNMWKAESENLSDEVIDWLCNRFRFTYGDIIEICSGIDKESRNLDETIKSVSRDYFKESLGDLVTSIKSPYTWDDLVVTKNVKKQLLNACSYVKYKNIVFEKMGLNAKVSYGKGLNILLKGAPGTGKTMAAQVIANHLDMELYKVDLSQIVSKYIGETEKNLNKIFDTCEGSGAVLFFDEMDALFSKRTEVKDSKDKNSNLEISFLLQRIEMYEGVVIMATNLLENVDEAFRRRIQYIVEFQIPTQNQRERILLNLLGGKLQTSEELDTKFISNFEIVGGEIKNIVLDSIFSALGNDDLLNNKYLILSTYRELEKQGKNPRMKDFGKYSYYIEEHYENYN
jgi:SpoVK/Ycf46/Vps4 family AAA+-type ATPase